MDVEPEEIPEKRLMALGVGLAGLAGVLLVAAVVFLSGGVPEVGPVDSTTTTLISGRFEAYVDGELIKIRSGCPMADPVLRGGADGLPRQGQTEKARVQSMVVDFGASLVDEFGAVSVEVMHVMVRCGSQPATVTSRSSMSRTIGFS